MALRPGDYRYIKLLELSPFERRGNGWRFGTRPIGNSVVARLLASGRAATDDKLVWLVKAGTVEMAPGDEPDLTPFERDVLRAIVLDGIAMPHDFTDAEQEAIDVLKARGLIAVTPRTQLLTATRAGRAVLAKAAGQCTH